MRSGHPRNAREPAIMMKPRRKRSIGEEPAAERYSFVITAIRNAPQTNPAISGLIYCTAEAVWSFMAPAESLIKQATQIAIFFGFPIKARSAPNRPITAPLIIKVLLF